MTRPVASGGAGGACAPHFLADQLTLSQPGGAHYAHHITTCHPGFLDLATALVTLEKIFLKFLLVVDYFSLLHKFVQNHKFSNKK